MIELYSPSNETELALLKGILDGEGIHYFVRNDHFGSMEVGPGIKLFNEKTILVDGEDYDRAKELVSDYISTVEEEGPEDQPAHSLWDKVRMALEVILFGWIMPGRRPRRKIDD